VHATNLHGRRPPPDPASTLAGSVPLAVGAVPRPVTARERRRQPPAAPLRRVVLTWLTRLRLLRDRVQMLPEHVASAAGLPADLHARLEGRTRRPRPARGGPDAGSLAAALGVDLRQLLLDTPAEPPLTTS